MCKVLGILCLCAAIFLILTQIEIVYIEDDKEDDEQ